MVHSRDRPLEHDINWTTLPQVLMEETSEWLSKARKSPQALVYRGTNVYGTLFQEDYFKLLETMLRLEQTAPDKLPLPIRLRKETVERWREENEAHKTELTRVIQQELGYLMVPIFRRTPREDQLLSSQLHGRRHPDRAGEDAGHAHRHRPDRRRHLRRLRHRPASSRRTATSCRPSISCRRCATSRWCTWASAATLNELRSKCRHRIDLGRDRLFRRAQRPRNGAETSSTQPRVASNAASASAQGARKRRPILARGSVALEPVQVARFTREPTN